jgi:hypothetical protein
MAVLSSVNTTTANGEKDAVKPATAASTMDSGGGPIGDECWYPVPVQNACDYYEQLEQILPTQYEILLRQIICKYRLNEPAQHAAADAAVVTANTATTLTATTAQKPNMKTSSSCFSLSNVNPNEYLHKILSTSAHITDSPIKTSDSVNATSGQVFLNWKNVWDYFYQLAEARITKDIVEHRECNSINESISSMHQQSMQSNQQQMTCSIIKPYLSSIAVATSSAQQLPKLQSHSSSSQCSQVSATPPFPKVVRETTTLTQLNAAAASNSRFSHEFQMSLFTSGNVCKVCSASFKSSKRFFFIAHDIF